MQSECSIAKHIPYSRIPHSSPLFLEYLSHPEKVARFYAAPVNLSDPVAADYDPARRARMADVLERQNREWGEGSLSPETEQSLRRFRAGASALVTGQQVSLFGGPLFAILKSVTAIKLARQWSVTSDAGFVPIFWLASEDHDLAEVNHGTLPGAANTLKGLVTSSAGVADAPMSEIHLNDDISRLVESAAEILGDSEVTSYLRASYRPGKTMSSAFARLWTQIFSRYGLLILDPSDAEVHSVASPIYTQAISRAAELNDALLQRTRELESAGFHPQVKVTPSSTTLFCMQNGSRMPVRRSGSDFSLGHERITAADLEARAEARPEDFSGSVLLRPVVQDYLLPTACYVGGPAEVTYFAQVSVSHEKLLGRGTPVLPRISATLIEQRIGKRMQRYGLGMQDVFAGVEHLRDLIAERSLPSPINVLFDRAVAGMETSLSEIKAALKDLDATLVQSEERAQGRIRYQLKRLQGRAARAHLRLQEQGERHAQEISQALYPHKNLQEREILGVYFLAKYGVGLLDRMMDELEIGEEHQVLCL